MNAPFNEIAQEARNTRLLKINDKIQVTMNNRGKSTKPEKRRLWALDIEEMDNCRYSGAIVGGRNKRSREID